MLSLIIIPLLMAALGHSLPVGSTINLDDFKCRPTIKDLDKFIQFLCYLGAFVLLFVAALVLLLIGKLLQSALRSICCGNVDQSANTAEEGNSNGNRNRNSGCSIPILNLPRETTLEVPVAARLKGTSPNKKSMNLRSLKSNVLQNTTSLGEAETRDTDSNWSCGDIILENPQERMVVEYSNVANESSVSPGVGPSTSGNRATETRNSRDGTVSFEEIPLSDMLTRPSSPPPSYPAS